MSIGRILRSGVVRPPVRRVYESVAVSYGCDAVRRVHFADWYSRYEPRLLLDLTAAYGPERGREAAAERWHGRGSIESG